MTSPDFKRRKVVSLKKAEAKLRDDEAKLDSAAGKKRSDATRKRASAQRSSLTSTKQRYEREAAKLDEDAGKLEDKAAAVATKLASNLDQQRQAKRSLEQSEDAARRRQEQEDDRRRRKEMAHARSLSRVAAPAVRYIHEVRHVPAPQPERLRVAYLAANPRVTDVDVDSGEVISTRIRVDKEIRDVQEEVRRSLHRDNIDIKPWVAATPIDVLNALNDQRPHVMHFSGHAGEGLLEFDDGEIEPEPYLVSLEQLAKALGATNPAPQVLVLNACDTLAGAEALLPAVPVIVATSATITDLAANVFAVRFYAAVASGQSIGHAVEQARYAMDVLAGGSGDVIQTVVREGVALDELVLVDLVDDVAIE